MKFNALVITDAAKYTKKQAKELIKEFRAKYPNHEGLAMRTDKSYFNEWAVHALAYKMGIMKAKAKDADLEFIIEPEVKLLYNLCGPIARIFLK